MIHRRIELRRGEHRYLFGWERGREVELIPVLVQLAEDPELDFDWEDASTVAYAVGRRKYDQAGAAGEGGEGGP